MRNALLAIGVAGVPLPAFELLAKPARSTAHHFDAARFAVLDALAETIMPRTDTRLVRHAALAAQRRTHGCKTRFGSYYNAHGLMQRQRSTDCLVGERE